MPNKKVFHVFEYERLRIDSYGFTRRHWELVGKWAERQKQKYIEVWSDSVRFLQWVGVIEVEDLVIEVLPKADSDKSMENRAERAREWHGILISLLRYSGLFDVKGFDSADLSIQNRSLLDIVFDKYLDAVSVLIAQGLVKKYRPVNKNRTVIKGRIDFSSNLRENIAHAEKIVTIADEYDPFNLLNHVLKLAVEISMMYAPSTSTKARARTLALYFADWPNMPISTKQLDAIQFDKKTIRYLSAYKLARLLISRYNPDLSTGSEKVFSILFDMNDLWESAMFIRLKKECATRLDLKIHGQSGKSFWCSESGTTKKVRPDIVISRDDKTTFIIDTKWKVPKSNIPDDQDLKQVFVYDLLWEAQNGYLLYPQTTASAQRSKGFYEHKVNESICSCGTVYASVDPEKWTTELLLPVFGIE